MMHDLSLAVYFVSARIIIIIIIIIIIMLVTTFMPDMYSTII